MIKKILTLIAVISLSNIIYSANLQADDLATFDEWLSNIENLAIERGISKNTADNALNNLERNPRVIELDRDQPEFTLTHEEYLNNTVTESRAKKGKDLYNEHKILLNKIRKEFGVQERFLLSLWGIETSFGRYTGSFNVVRSLATLSHDLRRRDFFTDELLNALQIIDEGHIDVQDMNGSWAGAMGQNQFMPSSFLNYAYDFNEDGRKDIWNTLPDIFASSANYLSQSGWDDNLTWGREVIITNDIDKSLITTSAKKINTSKPLNEWSSLGVKKTNGQLLPDKNIQAYLVYPDGEKGKKYLVYENFKVLMKWNRSLFFGISVGTLSDMIEYF